jgi:PD-(D/E)XK nuclease superfamily
MEDIMKLCDVVRETGFAIHRYHKHGHLEKVYENALAHRLRKLGLDVKQQYPLKVYDEDGTLIEQRNSFPLCSILTCSRLRRINAETQRARRNAEEKSLVFLLSLRLCVKTVLTSAAAVPRRVSCAFSRKELSRIHDEFGSAEADGLGRA